ncbi:predicted protein [Chaetoceros tenuissimus]|uniref:Uncharacterized protein n=1 Tax=Chaetoceros tenuissimus TaxID=426638 RepID=A0AAD3DC47_9STRA|nr:predicted protein [Chaetoceros tenuissimus]
MPRPDMRKQQLETEKKKRSTTTGNSTQDEEAKNSNVPPPVDDNKKKNKSKNKTKKSNAMASIEMKQMNQANSTLVASSSANSTTTTTNSSSTSSSSEETIFSKAIKGFTFFKQKNLESQEDQDTGNDNSKSSNNKSIRGQTSPSQAPTIMIHNNNDYSSNSNLQQTIPNCTSSYISCYSQTHPAFTIAIINTVFLYLYYIFCSKRKYSRKWRPHNKTRDARGQYSAVQVYDTLLDDFDDGQFSVSSSVYDDGDDSSESIGSVISQWSDIGNASRGGRSKSGARSVEMTIMGDDHLAMEEMNG